VPSLDDPAIGNVHIAVRYEDTFGGNYRTLCRYAETDNGECMIIGTATESTIPINQRGVVWD